MSDPCRRSWLLSNTTYGTWLPGDPRGSITSVLDRRFGDPEIESRIEHDLPGEPWEDYMPGLHRAAQDQMKCDPIYLNIEKCESVLNQFLETASHREWIVIAVALMSNHFHVVLQVPGDPKPTKVLADLKAYASRVLNKKYGKPPSNTWWTTNGSKRLLSSDKYLSNAIEYVLHEATPSTCCLVPRIRTTEVVEWNNRVQVRTLQLFRNHIVN